jgi:hypothetical protein
MAIDRYDPGLFRAQTFFDAVPRFLSGGNSPRDYLEQCLAVIAEREPRVRAWVTLNEPGAREAADASAQRYAEGRPLSPIDGMPIGIKDLYETKDLPTQMVAAGVPQQAVALMQQAGSGFDLNQLTGVGDLSATLQGLLPPEAQVLIPNIVEGVHGAFSLATAQTFWLGVVGSVIAVVAAVAIKEIPLCSSNAEPAFGEAPAASPATVRASTPAAGSAQATGTTPSPTTD